MGSGHCFNNIADTKKGGCQISMKKFDKISINEGTATFGSGVTFAKLTSYISGHGLALSNMPSTPHLNIVGAVVTGSHGSGHKNTIIAG